MSLGRLDRAGSLLSSVVDDRSLLSSAGNSGHGTIPRSHSLVQSIAEVVRVSLDPVPGLGCGYRDMINMGQFRSRSKSVRLF